MGHKNPALYNAMKSYVSAAIALVAERAVYDSSESVALEETFFFAKLAAHRELEGLSEYKECLEILTADATIAGQIDVLAGTHSGIRSRTQTAKGLMGSLLDLGLVPGRYSFNAEHFEREYAIFEEAYYSSDILYEAIAPLQGLLVDCSVHLSDDLEITGLGEEELSPVNPYRRTTVSSDPWREKLCAVRTKYAVPKVVGDDKGIDLEEAEKDRAKQVEVNNRIDQVVTALRLSGIENVYTPSIIHKTSQWTFGRDRFFPGRFQPEIFYSNQLEEQGLESFAHFWKTLQCQGVKDRKFLGIAIRRFGYAHERYRIEDKIVDLLIAAEALFLSDYSKGSYIGEIRYRLSLRASLFLASDTEVRRTIFRWMKAAYDLRSKVAHGGECKNEDLPKYQDGSLVSLDQFVWTIQDWVRKALIRAVHLAAEPNALYSLVDWEELVFSNGKASI